MLTILTIPLSIGAQQNSKDKAIATHITAIKELTGVIVLCSDKPVLSSLMNLLSTDLPSTLTVFTA